MLAACADSATAHAPLACRCTDGKDYWLHKPGVTSRGENVRHAGSQPASEAAAKLRMQQAYICERGRQHISAHAKRVRTCWLSFVAVR